MTRTRGAVVPGDYPPMTYEEYINAPGIPEHTEWVNGRVVPMMPVSKKHSDLSTYLIGLLGLYVRHRNLGEVYADPFNMKLGGGLPGRAPDLLFVLSEHLGRVGEQFLEGPADLVIEIISPGTEGTDRGEKFYEYQEGGVAEYWILDPHREVAEFYVLDSEGVFRAAYVPVDGEFASTVVDGFRLKVQWLWDLADPLDVLAELGVGRA